MKTLVNKKCALLQARTPIKRTLTKEDFSSILEHLHKNRDTYVQRRRIIAFVLLYVTGLQPKRISLLTKDDLQNFFNGKSLFFETKDLTCYNDLHVQWSDQPFVSVTLTEAGLSFVQQYVSLFNSISDRRETSSYVFTKESQPKTPMSGIVLEKEISILLRDYNTCSKLRTKLRIPDLKCNEQLFITHFTKNIKKTF